MVKGFTCSFDELKNKNKIKIKDAVKGKGTKVEKANMKKRNNKTEGKVRGCYR